MPDPRIASQIRAALGDAQSVCNVGAGTGSYEVTGRSVVAVEPSRGMIQQRQGGAIVRAVAEALPFSDHAFDACMAVLTLHHWRDVLRGIAEMCRIAPRRVVLTFDPACLEDLWLVRDYVPALADLDRERSPSIDLIAGALGADRVEPVRVPWDCTDGFLAAYWRRPQLYLEPDARACISGLSLLPPGEVEEAMQRLADDPESGEWARRNAHLLERQEMDYGYRLLVAGSCD